MQIGFVRDRDDDRELWTWLAERYDLLCLPRIATVADGLHPIAPIDAPPRALTVFPRANTRIVLELAAANPIFDGGKRVTFGIERGGYSFEWGPTLARPNEEYVLGEGAPRVYYKSDECPDEQGHQVKLLYQAIARHVKTTSPLLAGGDHVGPHLAAKLRAGSARIVYYVATDAIVTVPNPAFKEASGRKKR